MTRISNDPLPTFPEFGVVYIATGKFLEEAILSVKSLKACMPEMHVTLFSESQPADKYFDQWIEIHSPTFTGLDKALMLKHTPYKKTIYLDSDTMINHSLKGILERLDDWDFLATIEVGRGYWYRDELGVPSSFPEVNGGILAFVKTSVVEELLIGWEKEIHKTRVWQKRYGPRVWDQPALRKLLWNYRNEIKLGILPSEYNVISTWGTYIFGDPIIIHTRHKPEEMLRKTARYSNCERAWLPQIGCVRSPYRMEYKEWFSVWWRFQVVFLMGMGQKIKRSVSSLWTRKN